MTLGQFSRALGVAPKWVLNALSSIGGSRAYTVAAGERFAIALELLSAFDMSLSRSMALAAAALEAWRGQRDVVQLTFPPDSLVAVELDVYRILARFSTRLSVALTNDSSGRRGRPATAVSDPMQAASAWGLDLSLLERNLMLSPAERLAQLDAMVAFRRGAMRVAERA
jgi:hypothetical protein